VSSNSFVTEGPVRGLLARSFEVLAHEQPRAAERLRARLAGLAVGLRIDSEHFAAEFTPERVLLRPPDGHEPVSVVTSRRAILDVLEARQTLAEAVLHDAVGVVGPLDTLLRLQEGLIHYIHGAVRCAGFPPLLRQLKGQNHE
jgi:hypothetical protein